MSQKEVKKEKKEEKESWWEKIGRYLPRGFNLAQY